MAGEWKALVEQKRLEKQSGSFTDSLGQALLEGQHGLSQSRTPTPKASWQDLVQQRQSEKMAPEEQAEPFTSAASQPQEDESWYESAWNGTKNLVTGGDRNPNQLPEFDMPFEPTWRQAKTAMGLLTTFDPKEQVKVFASNYPDLKFEEDEHGDIIVDGSAYGAERGMLNAPGMSLRDLTQMGFQVAAFNPAAKLASAGTTTLRRAGMGAGYAGLTQTGNDLTSQAMGREESVSLGNTNWGEVGTAAVAGGGAELLTSALGRMVPAMRKKFIETGDITDDMRQAFIKAADEKGLPAESISDDLIRDYMNLSRNGIKPKGMGDLRNALRVEEYTDEFGIPYSRGQATANPANLNAEDKLRHGALGEKGQAVLQKFDEAQDQAVTTAKNNVQADLSSMDAPQISRVNEAGDMITEAMQGKAAALDAQVGEAYDAVGEAYLSSEGLSGLMKATKNSVRGVEFNSTLKGTASILSGVRDMEKTIRGFGAQLKPTHLKKIEKMRQRFNTEIGAAENASDKRQLMQMKSAFDGYLDTAVDNALLSGDDQALNALKEARALRTKYALDFQRNDKKTKGGRTIKDAAGDVVERIVEANPTSSEVVNYFFGASQLSKNGSSKIAGKVKGILGEDSAEWNALREAAFLKLTATETGSKPVSAKVFGNRLDDAIRGKGEELMRVLFTEKERLQFMRLSAAIKKADKTAQNPSKTSYAVAGIVNQFVPKFFSGFARRAEVATGMSGEPSMYAASRVANIGASALEGRAGMKAAKQATSQRFLRPFNKVKGNGNIPGAMTAVEQDAWQSQREQEELVKGNLATRD